MSVRIDQDALLIAAPKIATSNTRVDQEALLIAVKALGVGNTRLGQIFVSMLVPVGPGSGQPTPSYGQIAYPLSIPSTLGESKANLKQIDAIGEVISPFTGLSQQQAWQDQHWELDLEFPPMTWAQFAAYQAFTGALHGKFGRFLWGPAQAAAGPRGAGGGTPLLPATGQLTIISMSRSGNVVTCDCFPPFFGASFIPGARVIVNWTDTTFNGTFPILTATTFLGGGGPTFQFTWIQNDPDVSAETPPSFTGTLTSLASNNAGSSLLVTTGWGSSRSGILLPGDFLQITALDVNGISRKRLHQYVNPNPLNSDSNGNALIDIFPSLRETPADLTPIVLTNPQGEFRLADNRREAPSQSDKTYSLQLKAREAI